LLSGPTYRAITGVDRVGFEPTTTYVSSANLHARQVFYQSKLPAHLIYHFKHVVLLYFIVVMLIFAIHITYIL
jgi:hypothetical protein